MNEHVSQPERVRESIIKAVTSALSLMEEALTIEKAQGAQGTTCVLWEAV